jgi:seryl-tRNA synthetase
MDLDIRLKNLSVQEERYRQLLNKATEMEEILKIENELNRMRTEIERLQGRQKRLDQQINYSTITAEFRQPEPIISGTPDIIRAIRNAINRMVDQFYQIIILIGTVIPYLLLLVIGYLIYRKFRKN